MSSKDNTHHKSELERMLAYNQALELKERGMSVDSIAKELGYSVSNMYYIFKHHPRKIPQEMIDAEKKRLLEVVDKDHRLKMDNQSDITNKYLDSRNKLLDINNRYLTLLVGNEEVGKSLKFCTILVIVTLCLMIFLAIGSVYLAGGKYTSLIVYIYSFIVSLTALVLTLLLQSRNRLSN